MLLIRADASVTIGTGHIMRCLALAQAWRNRIGPVKFLCACIPDNLLKRLNDEAFEVVTSDTVPGSDDDLDRLLEIQDQEAATYLMVDGYQFDDNFQTHLSTSTARTLFLDDYGHCKRYDADWILNQNLGADSSFYDNRSERTKLLLGSSYALLRQEFLRLGGQSFYLNSPIENVLITLGGSDPQNLTLSVLTALTCLKCRPLKVRVVLGAGNPHSEEFSNIVDSIHEIEVLTNVYDMASLMRWADIAICSGGSTNWEFAYFGTPRVVLIQADNQVAATQELEKAGCVQLIDARKSLDLDRLMTQFYSLANSSSLIHKMSNANKLLVDGQGVNRILTQIYHGEVPL
ncbi:UDP-2,4-diacetamido-2,4,6-trideoxy-beta-L-altropyranose hydrolase [Bremerella alba]|uniref:UDP-2,4-diacetamido-2,4, 6-trideoxy-beta-L-altropyranose hydrolase n=1 Tax=Bremerella alba TaxID=980252 RepID=A0A7V8V0Y6_9BACT|nr:UDP-2,4-diacetamido-2,4,6-trideoxy-beta-L-altropyranose hydrolase [Bremerella alba]MBA2112920.1 UDP-2,4-diacetamido-2,4,6-trideoxy-beta-L-altropyranose hydrolase [Bremerella alba]